MMSDQTYRIIFQGRIQKGFSIDSVKNDFARMFKLTPEKTEKMFSGREITIRSNLSREQALKYEKAILKTGAQCRVLKDRPESGPERTDELSGGDRPPVSPGTRVPPAHQAQKDFSSILETYRSNCRPPQCRLAPDIPGDLLEEITGIWEKCVKEESILAWFEIKRYPGKVFGMLLTDRNLHVRSETSGKRSIPIGEIGRMRILQKNKKWELEFGVSNLYRDLPKKIHEPLEHFLCLCFEIGGLKPRVDKRVVIEKKESPSPKTEKRAVAEKQENKSGKKKKAESESDADSDHSMMPFYIICALVTILANAELLVGAGANPIVAFIIGCVILLLLPTVIGLVIGSFLVGWIYDLPGLAMAFRCLFGGLLGAVAGLIIGFPLGHLFFAGKKKPVEPA